MRADVFKLAQWSNMHLNKLIVADHVKEFPTFYEKKLFLSVLKTATNARTEPHKFRSHASNLVP